MSTPITHDAMSHVRRGERYLLHNGADQPCRANGAAVAVTEISDDDLDAYLNMPDCPQCGSDDVECTDTHPDGFGNIVKVYYCKKCGHIWTQVE